MDPLALAYGKASQRVTCPHRDDAVPSADVNVTILDDEGTELVASTAATKGSFSTTVGTAASEGDRSIVLASVANLSVGEPIVFEDDGESELHVAKSIDSATTTVELEDRIGRDLAVGATAKSARIYYDLDASDTDTFPIGTYYQAIFTSTAWTEARGVIFRIVDKVTDNPITFAHMRRWVPHISTLADDYDKANFEEARTLAWHIVRMKLRAAKRDPDVFRDAIDAHVGDVGGCLAAALFCEAHGDVARAGRLAGDPERGELGEGGWFSSLWPAFEKAVAWFDRDGDRAVDSGERRRAGRFVVGRGV